MSAGYVSTDGVLITDKDTYERLNINSYISADITKWFTQELTMSYARTNQRNLIPVWEVCLAVIRFLISRKVICLGCLFYNFSGFAFQHTAQPGIVSK